MVAVLVALWVLPRAFALARAALRILERVLPSHIDVEELRSALGAVDGVTGVHDLHVWTLVPGKDMVTAHLTSSADTQPGCSTTRGRSSNARGLAHATVQVEPPDAAGGLLVRGEGLETQPEAELAARGRIAVVEQIQAALEFVGFADVAGGPASEATHRREPLVRLMGERHRAEALPAVAPQLIQPAVITGAGVGIVR